MKTYVLSNGQLQEAVGFQLTDEQAADVRAVLRCSGLPEDLREQLADYLEPDRLADDITEGTWIVTKSVNVFNVGERIVIKGSRCDRPDHTRDPKNWIKSPGLRARRA